MSWSVKQQVANGRLFKVILALSFMAYICLVRNRRPHTAFADVFSSSEVSSSSLIFPPLS
jgi:uncharacterized membrane protein